MEQKQALLESGTTKVVYIHHPDVGAWVTELWHRLGNSDFMDYTDTLEFKGVRQKWTEKLNEKLKA
jgi:hypothetical protein